MGQLFDMSKRIQQHIDDEGLDVFRIRGMLAMQCGFLITLIHEDEPDDPEKVAALRTAALDVLDLRI
jgi:hypothetical protein